MRCERCGDREMYSEIEHRNRADYEALDMRPPETYPTFGAWLAWFLTDYLPAYGDNKFFIDLDCSLAAYMDRRLEQLRKRTAEEVLGVRGSELKHRTPNTEHRTPGPILCPQCEVELIRDEEPREVIADLLGCHWCCPDCGFTATDRQIKMVKRYRERKRRGDENT